MEYQNFEQKLSTSSLIFPNKISYEVDCKRDEDFFHFVTRGTFLKVESLKNSKSRLLLSKILFLEVRIISFHSSSLKSKVILFLKNGASKFRI